MLFAASGQRYLYTKSPLVEVICQLRFPTILSIGAKEPAEFQEAIRGEYPRYAAKQEFPMPKLAGAGTPNPSVQQQPPITNYHFISQDGVWKVNLTNNFIALSTMRYSQW
ncbi:MAG: TIGR04255 family protein, partial [Oscillospiraceae bacterium]